MRDNQEAGGAQALSDPCGGQRLRPPDSISMTTLTRPQPRQLTVCLSFNEHSDVCFSRFFRSSIFIQLLPTLSLGEYGKSVMG